MAKRKYSEVLHRLLAEVVVDAEDRVLGEDLVERPRSAPAPIAGRGRTASRPRRARRRRSPTASRCCDHGGEQRSAGSRGSGAGASASPERLAQPAERRRVAVVAVRRSAGGPTSFANAASSTPAVLLEAVAARAPRAASSVPARLRDADDRHVEVPAAHQRLERREDLLVGEVAGGAEEARARRSAPRDRSRAPRRPPLLLHVAAELEAHRGEDLVLEVVLAARAKRSKSAAVSTGAGTPSSIAAIAVQRPSPESETRPANARASGSSCERRAP